jgi:hypothetical protein
LSRIKKPKLIKDHCEIQDCPINDPKMLDLHHIVERIEANCTNHPFNLAILCSNHHRLHHSGQLKIIGVLPSTKGINGRSLVYEINGIRNILVSDDDILQFKNKAMKI